MKLELVATCLFGLEHLLGEEIEALGYNKLSTINGRVTFLGDEEAVALSNVFLRYAERVLIKVGSFRATSFEELFEGTRRLPFPDLLPRDAAFPVKGHSIKSVLRSVPDCQAIIKKAIARTMGERYGLEYLPEDGVKHQIEFFILNDECTVMIDTSGDPLHKRGYRREANAAPIRETLAAAIVATARPREEVLLWDPMCGSGTIAIEAAMMMRGIAPGMRRNFAGENFPILPKENWRNAKAEALESIRPSEFTVYATDIDPDAVKLTRENAYRAGVLNSLRCYVADARQIGFKDRRGTIVTNPPYGERLGTQAEVEALYKDIGARFRYLEPWQTYVITSHPGFEALYGRRADKVKKLYNGMLECYLYQFFKNNKR